MATASGRVGRGAAGLSGRGDTHPDAALSSYSFWGVACKGVEKLRNGFGVGNFTWASAHCHLHLLSSLGLKNF